MILVTGANGFVGQAVVKDLFSSGRTVRACVRREEHTFPIGVEQTKVFKLEDVRDWEGVVSGIDVVVHVAGLAHVVGGDDNFQPYYDANVRATMNLAKAASEAGARRFIFISSIKVHGEYSKSDSKIQIQDLVQPSGSYGKSKRQAELELLKFSETSDMDVVIVRPPLVYGPNVKANFLSLLRWIDKGYPVPSALKKTKRSFLSLSNLADFISLCIDAPAASNQIFLVSDDNDISTFNLTRKIASSIGRNHKTIPVSAGFLKLLFLLIGKKGAANRLLSSLQVDISETKKQLDWSPKFSLNEGINEIVRTYKDDVSS